MNDRPSSPKNEKLPEPERLGHRQHDWLGPERPRGFQQRPMPIAVREPFEILNNETIHLHYRWKVYKQLYADPRRVELLNAAAPGYFGLAQRIWEDTLVLGVARLLDRTAGATSLRVLVDRMASSGPHTLVASLKERLECLELIDGAIQEHRKRRLAHIDAEHHPRGGGKVLPPIEGFDRFFVEIAALMNAVGEGVGYGTTIYADPEAESLSDGVTLILGLRKATRFDELFPNVMDCRDQLRQGRFADLATKD